MIFSSKIVSNFIWKKNLLENDFQNLEGFNSIKDIGSPDSFRPNKCPIKLGEKYFGKIQK